MYIDYHVSLLTFHVPICDILLERDHRNGKILCVMLCYFLWCCLWSASAVLSIFGPWQCEIFFFLWIHDSRVMCFHDGNVRTALLLDIYMVTSWHGNTFCVTVPLWGKPSVTGGFPSQRVSGAELWWFLCYQPKQVLNKLWVATDLKHREVDTHVMSL